MKRKPSGGVGSKEGGKLDFSFSEVGTRKQRRWEQTEEAALSRGCDGVN